MNYLFFKTFCACDDKKLAEETASIMSAHLNAFCVASLFKVEKYWKISEYFEISFDIETELTPSLISKKLANNWQHVGNSLIWNYEDEFFFLSDAVRWALLEPIE